MNFNTIRYRFGLEPNDFVNRLIEPIKADDGFVYELWQKDTNRKCPYCSNENNYKHNYYYAETSCTINSQLKETLRIRKIRYKCRQCGRTFTNPIYGIDTKDTITAQIKEMIVRDFCQMFSFKEDQLLHACERTRTAETVLIQYWYYGSMYMSSRT